MAKRESCSDLINSQMPIDYGARSIAFIAGIFILGCVVYRSGYDKGLDVANKVLRRHDKDAKKMKKEAAKREKELRRDLCPEEETKWKWPWQK